MARFDFIARDAANPYAPLSLPAEPQTRRQRPVQAPRQVRPRDWVVTMVVALLVALFIRSFLLEAFRIPTSSMEKSLLAGDFVLVSKLHYGPRTPVTIGIPFSSIYAPGVELPALRMPGFNEPRRGDVVVFNYPGDDGPVDRKTHYIKRLVALPGDTFAIVNKIASVNGVEMLLGEHMQQKWMAFRRPNAAFPTDRLHERGVEHVSTIGARQEGVSFEASVAVAREVSSWAEVATVEPLVTPRDPDQPTRIFPQGSGFVADNYGPLYVPARGDTLHLTAENWPAYADVVTRYEGHRAELRTDGTIVIDGAPTDRYVVEQDYFFVMGDNRDSSFDSRIWGFVPEDHMVGKAIVIYFSWDQEEGRPRAERIFDRIQ